MPFPKRFVSLCLLPLLAACGGSSNDDSTLSASWAFESGDCTTNGVETVRVTWTAQGGTPETAEFACADGSGDLGDVGSDGGSYSITAEGLDADGVVRAASYGQTLSFSGGAPPIPVEVTLHPKAASVIVSWSIQGGGTCPQGVVLPYFVALYVPPATAGGELTNKVTEVQETCSAGMATLTDVAPGNYIVEVDSRAVTPALRGTAPVTVEAGTDATVSIDL